MRVHLACVCCECLLSMTILDANRGTNFFVHAYMFRLSAPQVVVGATWCQGEGCSKYANFNFPGKPPQYCKAHTQEGMVRCMAGCSSLLSLCLERCFQHHVYISVPVDVHRRM